MNISGDAKRKKYWSILKKSFTVENTFFFFFPSDLHKSSLKSDRKAKKNLKRDKKNFLYWLLLLNTVFNIQHSSYKGCSVNNAGSCFSLVKMHS